MESKKILDIEIFSDGTITYCGKKLNPYLLKSGCINYLRVCFRLDNKQWRVLSVPRLVATAFIDNPHNYPHVLHKNGNRMDCRAENLIWGIGGWKEFKIKVSQEKIEQILFDMDVDKLSPFALDLYLYILGDEQYLIERMDKPGNTSYMYAIVKNDISSLKFNESRVVRLIIDDFLDDFYSLIRRGYFLPKEDYPDGIYWCYIRNHLKKRTLRFFSQKTYRDRLLYGFSAG